MFTPLTERDLLLISARTGERLEAFIKSPKLNKRELASLSREVLMDMERPSNMLEDLIMMKVLKEIREEEV